MRTNQSNTSGSIDNHADDTQLRRRGFLASGAGVGTAMLAGCTGASDGFLESSGDDGASSGSSGQFRLLVSDQPSAIGDFAELNVTFEKARVFRGEGAAQDDDAVDGQNPGNNSNDAGNGDDDTDPGDATIEENGEDEEKNANGNGDDESGNGDDDTDDGDNQVRGFVEIDLEDETADLTELIGEKATEVADVSLETGRYASIQMFVAEVEGIASDAYDPDDGPGGGNQDDRQTGRPDDTTAEVRDEDDTEIEEAGDDEIVLPVKLPSERLQIVRPFDIVEGEQIEFVFDINVIRRGDGEYILQPVIGESGIVGEDIEADVIDDEEDEGEEEEVEDEDDEADAEDTDPEENGENDD